MIFLSGFQKGYNILSTCMTFALKHFTIWKTFARSITYRALYGGGLISYIGYLEIQVNMEKEEMCCNVPTYI